MSDDEIKPSKLCRICLDSTEKMNMSIFENYGDYSINEYILKITNVSIKKEDGLPDKICSTCFMEFETAVNFKQKCQRTDLFLKTSKHKVIESCANADVDDTIIIKKEDPYEEEIKLEYNADDNILDEANFNVKSFKSRAIDLKLECHDCGNIFKSKCKLRVHWKKVHMLNSLICEICKRQFKSYRAYHLHKKKSTRNCKTASSDLVRVEGTGKSRIFYCNECNYKTLNPTAIQAHTLVHSGDKPFQCNICQNRYTQHSSLQSHMEGAHKKYVKEVTCHFCGKQLKGRTNTYRHMQMHTQAKQPCPICHKTYPKRNLKQHMLRHSETKLYTCEKCASSFYTQSELCNHKRSVHNDKNDAYKCDLCSYVAKRSDRIKLHKQNHTETNIPCTICGRFFSTVPKMEAHQKQHFAEKTNECSYCNMKFYRRNSLGNHVRSKHKSSFVPIAKEHATPISCKVETIKNKINKKSVKKLNHNFDDNN